MDYRQMLEALCEAYGPVKVAEFVGVTYQTVWRWRTMVNGIPGTGKRAIELSYEKALTGTLV